MSSHLSAGSTQFSEVRPSQFSLVFQSAHRPTAEAVMGVLQSRVGDAATIAVSQGAGSSAGWLALDTAGHIVELSGLAPAASAPMPEIAHWYGFSIRPAVAAAEAIALTCGADGRAGELLPQVRAMAGIARRLARLADVTAIVWHPARSAMSPAAFVAAIDSWLSGGPFPALGLTALFRDDAGAIRSEGLAFFTGQEVHIEPDLSSTTAQDAKIAARLINHLVGGACINEPFEMMGPDGEQLSVEPPGSDGFIRIWRKS